MGPVRRCDRGGFTWPCVDRARGARTLSRRGDRNRVYPRISRMGAAANLASRLLKNYLRRILERQWCDIKAGEAVKLGVFRAEPNDDSVPSPPKSRGAEFFNRLLRRSAIRMSLWVGVASAVIAVPFVGLLAFVELGVYGDKPTSVVALVGFAVLRWMLIFGIWQMLYLGAGFVRMGREAALRELQLAQDANLAELRALRAQLNPHFLFNTLNSIRALVGDDADDARDAITQLARILRYSLASDGKDTVPLADELAFVQDYLALEKLRLGHRLAFNIVLEARALAVHVPTMLVQTLVENAIKHGISQLADGGSLSVYANFTDASMCLTIENVAPREPSLAMPDAHGIQLGLRNARARLQRLVGNRGALKYERISAPAAEVDCIRVLLLVPE
jgi:Histidine kinase